MYKLRKLIIGFFIMISSIFVSAYIFTKHPVFITLFSIFYVFIALLGFSNINSLPLLKSLMLK